MRCAPCLLLLAILPNAWAADAEPKLPPAVAKAIADGTAQVQKAHEAYAAATQKILDATERVLKAEWEKQTKAGREQEASATKRVLDTFRRSITDQVNGVPPATAQPTPPGAPEDLLGDGAVPDLSKEVLGTWLEVGGTNGLITITKDTASGEFLVAHSGGAQATLVITNNATVTITWANGWKIADLAFNRGGRVFLGRNVNPGGGFQGRIALVWPY